MNGDLHKLSLYQGVTKDQNSVDIKTKKKLSFFPVPYYNIYFLFLFFFLHYGIITCVECNKRDVLLFVSFLAIIMIISRLFLKIILS